MLDYIAQEIAEVASNTIGYPVILTDKNSIIIGTDDENVHRIGSLHEASVRTIRECRQYIHSEEACRNLEGTFPGTTMPIVIDDDVVGTIGIRGDSEIVIKFGMLVKMIAEIMLKDRIEAESAHIKHTNMQMLVTMILAFQETNYDEHSVIMQANLLNYNMTLSRAAVLISQAESLGMNDYGIRRDLYSTTLYRRIKKAFPNKQDIIVALQGGMEKYLVFTVVPDNDNNLGQNELISKCKAFAAEIYENDNIDSYIGIGTTGNNVSALRESYEMAYKAFNTAIDGSLGKVIASKDIPLEEFIAGIAEPMGRKKRSGTMELILKRKDANECIELIISWCETMFNFSKTAENLGIHRSTLKYRFERIESELGIDMHNFKAVVAIYIEIKVYQYNKSNYNGIW